MIKLSDLDGEVLQKILELFEVELSGFKIWTVEPLNGDPATENITHKYNITNV